MSENQFILAIDQGTSSTKCLVFDSAGDVVARGTAPLYTSYLPNGVVEQDPEAIYENVLDAVRGCLQQFTAKGYQMENIVAIGIDNQRETFITWNATGKPLHPAVVWQCKRSVGICDQLKAQGLQDTIREKTGLVIDPYFSATKLIWLCQQDANIREAIQQGEAFFGTVDTWLLYRLTNGTAYATDYTNASRTMFFNLHTLRWDEALLEAYGLTGLHLPEIKPSAALFGHTTIGGLLDAPIPILSLIGDSHAAAFGEGCYTPGTAKATLGTGCSILMNIGDKPLPSANGMVTTVCWSMENRIDFAYEGVIVSCGATIEWLKQELGLFADSRDTEDMANAVDSSGGVYFIPAFSGLGSPHWQMERRASVSGISFGTTKNHLVRAALESIPYQVKDVISGMEKDAGIALTSLNADGGISANKFVVQLMANLLEKKVATIGMPDVSALGAALLAGLKAGVYPSLEALQQLGVNKKYFEPASTTQVREDYRGWLHEIAQYTR